MQTDIALGYSGSYERFDTVSKKEASVLMGADNLVGDRFAIEFKTDNGTTVAWMKNKFGALVGYFNPEVSRLVACRPSFFRCVHRHARAWKVLGRGCNHLLRSASQS